MKKIVGYILVLLLAVSSCFAYTGCQKNTSESQVYKVYYMNSSANKLVEKSYKTETSDTLVHDAGIDATDEYTSEKRRL